MLKIKNYLPVHNSQSCVIAELDVYIVEWDFNIRKIQECRKGDKHWFNWPSKYEEDPTGATKGKFIPVASFGNEETSKRFFASLRSEVKKLNEAEEEAIPF